MGMDGGGLSVADALALGRNYGDNDNNGWGDGNGYWVFFLFFLLAWGNGGWGGFGNGNGAGLQGALTRADLCQDMNFQSLENAVRGVQQGICDSTFALNNSINNVGMNMMNGFHGVDNAICNLGHQTQQGFNATNIAMLQGQNALQAQLAQCCCDNRMGQADIRYQMAADTCALQNTMNNNTRDSIDATNSGIRAIMDRLCQMEYNSLNDKYQATLAENQTLKLAASQSEQNAFIAANQNAQTAELIRRLGADCPVNAVVVQPNTPVTFPTNCCGNFAGFNGFNNFGFRGGRCNDNCCDPCCGY